MCNALLATRKIVCEWHKTACLGYSGVRTLCEHVFKIGLSENKRKFSMPLFSMHIFMSLQRILVKLRTQYLLDLGKRKVCIRAKWPIRPEFIPVSVA